jgi:hypothetical protein
VLEEGEHAPVRLNADRLRARAAQAGVLDEYGIQQLCESGIFSHSEARHDLLLAVNYRGVGEYSCFCADLVQAEADDGIVSHGYVGIPLFSCRLHPRNVVAGAKPRMVADLGALRDDDDGGGADSVNAGIAFYDEERLRKLRLPAPTSFAAWVGLLQTCGLRVRIGRPVRALRGG